MFLVFLHLILRLLSELILSNRGKISFPTTDSYLSKSLISAGNPIIDYGLYVVDSTSNANSNLHQNYVRQTTSGNYSVSVGAANAFRVSNSNGIFHC